VPKQRSKTEIISRMEAERRRLEKNMEGLSREEIVSTPVVGDWTVKDVLAHLAEWEACMPGWLAKARAGQKVINPADDLTWKQLDVFNQRVYEKYCDWPLEEVRAFYERAHAELLDMVRGMSHEELLTPGYYTFTGKGAVYDWMSAFAAHDRWAKTKILHWRQAQPG